MTETTRSGCESLVESGLFVAGWGVHLRDLDLELGVRGNYRADPKGSEEPPRWGYSSVRRDGCIQDSVEEVLAWIRPAAPRLHRLFRNEPAWRGSVVVRFDMGRMIDGDGALQFRLQPEAVSEIADLGLLLDVGSR